MTDCAWGGVIFIIHLTLTARYSSINIVSVEKERP